MRAMGLSVFLSVLLLAGCGGDDGGSPPVSVDPDDDGGTGNDRCVDEDGDGAGRRCAGGFDCNDDDPNITDECTRCLEPEKNCPCDEGTEGMACIPDNLGEEMVVNGRLLQCEEGARYCQEAAGVEDTWVWTDCVGIFR